MDLSVIIVSYNVKYFLEQCICSVKSAFRSLEVEILVIDNNSSDGSVEYLSKRYPFVQFIKNAENLGFAKANNKALQVARGRNILFLNPDTILAEDSLTRTVSYLDQTPTAGSLGIRMIDGSGKFLKESKRGFPSAWASFCKITGLTTAFPNSRTFAKYYLGHLSPKENHMVDALSGAFMMVKKEVLVKTGGFDERFFMYAEDIDLSIRIKKQGYHNYYFAESTIVHFKGESTLKEVQYTRLFYLAMIQFVQKYKKNFSAFLIVGLLRLLIELKVMIVKIKRSIIKTQRGVQIQPVQFEVKGDPDSIKEISASAPITETSENLIYCTGNQYSHSQMIREIEAQSGKGNVFMHAFNTQSIIGSRSKDKQGITISCITRDQKKN